MRNALTKHEVLDLLVEAIVLKLRDLMMLVLKSEQEIVHYTFSLFPTLVMTTVILGVIIPLNYIYILW